MPGTHKSIGTPLANWHETILTKLDRYTGFDVDIGETHIIVTCQNPYSFEVSIYEDGGEFQVGFAGWHEHFDAEEDALNCFAFGLSQECRLKIVKRGKMECSWTLQSRENGAWIDDTTTGLIIIPFWRPTEIEHRHNIIKRKDDG